MAAILAWFGLFSQRLANNPRKKPHISHVMEKAYEYNDAKAALETYTDHFRLQFDRLIDDAVKPELTGLTKKGNREDLCRSKFQKIIETMHEDRADFEKLKILKGGA